MGQERLSSACSARRRIPISSRRTPTAWPPVRMTRAYTENRWEPWRTSSLPGIAGATRKPGKTGPSARDRGPEAVRSTHPTSRALEIA